MPHPTAFGVCFMNADADSQRRQWPAVLAAADANISVVAGDPISLPATIVRF